jgi:hypothetical protein
MIKGPNSHKQNFFVSNPYWPTLGPTQPYIQWIPVFLPGGKVVGAWCYPLNTYSPIEGCVRPYLYGFMSVQEHIYPYLSFLVYHNDNVQLVVWIKSFLHSAVLRKVSVYFAAFHLASFHTKLFSAQWTSFASYHCSYTAHCSSLYSLQLSIFTAAYCSYCSSLHSMQFNIITAAHYIHCSSLHSLQLTIFTAAQNIYCSSLYSLQLIVVIAAHYIHSIPLHSQQLAISTAAHCILCSSLYSQPVAELKTISYK